MVGQVRAEAVIYVEAENEDEAIEGAFKKFEDTELDYNLPDADDFEVESVEED